MHVQASVAGDSFYEVTFYAKVGSGEWQPIGTTTTRRTRSSTTPAR
jgi:hypothetical protein